MDASHSAEPSSLIGRTLGNYRVLEKLGSGGMGVVYRAEDTRLGRQVALKFLAESIASDPAALERFSREARLAAALNHPHIATIYDVGEHDGYRFIAMELLEGLSLQHRIAGQPMPLDEVLAIGADVADALAVAHASGIVHRDIKPGNIFITTRGVVKVLDFGLAKPMPAALRPGSDADETRLAERGHVTGPGSAMGTIAYMSPEQARGEEVDARTDLFSLGVVLYEMLTGRQAFAGTTAVIFDGILNRTPPAPHSINGGVPPEVEGIIARAMEKDRQLRFRAADELRDDLRRIRKLAESGETRPHEPSKTPSGWRLPAPGTTGGLLRRRAWQAVGALALLAAIFSLVEMRQWRKVEAIGEGDTVLVTDFVNSTGDAVFDGTLKQALAVKLEESPFLNVLGEQRVQETLRFMQRKPDAALTREVGRDVCQRQGIRAMIAGEIARLGSSYIVTLTAENCATGDVLAREQVQADSKEAVLKTLGTAVAALRGRLGESLASVQKNDTPIEQATTSSLDALKAYSLGDKERARGGELEASSFYRRAVELDPDFAMAHARLGTVYANLGERERSIEQRKKAYSLRDRVSERERLYINAHYFASVENDTAKATEVYELWKRTYPRDSVPYINLGQIYTQSGDNDRALASYLRAIELTPKQPLAYENAASAYMKDGKYEEARKVVDREVAAIGPNPQASMLLFELAALRHDYPAMDRHAVEVRGSAYEAGVLQVRAQSALQGGKLGEFRRLIDEQVALLERQGLRERSSLSSSQRIVAEALVGNTGMARDLAARLLARENPTPESLIDVGLGLVIAGDVERGARSIDAGLSKVPKGTADLDRSASMLHAAVELGRRRPAQALALLDPLEPMAPKDGKVFGSMLIRGDALRLLGRHADAEAQYQKLLDTRSLSPFDVALPLAHLGVADARARAGDVKGAREAYEAFFEMWKDADPDVPLLRKARVAYEKLSST